VSRSQWSTDRLPPLSQRGRASPPVSASKVSKTCNGRGWLRLSISGQPNPKWAQRDDSDEDCVTEGHSAIERILQVKLLKRRQYCWRNECGQSRSIVGFSPVDRRIVEVVLTEMTLVVSIGMAAGKSDVLQPLCIGEHCQLYQCAFRRPRGTREGTMQNRDHAVHHS
jgi:hypothetical protein